MAANSHKLTCDCGCRPRVDLRLPRAVRGRLRILAAASGSTLQAYVERVLVRHVKRAL